MLLVLCLCICFYAHEKTLDKRKTRLVIKYLLDSLLFFLVNLTFKQTSEIPINLDLVLFMANISLYSVDGRWLLNKNSMVGTHWNQYLLLSWRFLWYQWQWNFRKTFQILLPYSFLIRKGKCAVYNMPEYDFSVTHIFSYRDIIFDFVLKQAYAVKENPHCVKCRNLT